MCTHKQPQNTAQPADLNVHRPPTHRYTTAAASRLRLRHVFLLQLLRSDHLSSRSSSILDNRQLPAGPDAQFLPPSHLQPLAFRVLADLLHAPRRHKVLTDQTPILPTVLCAPIILAGVVRTMECRILAPFEHASIASTVLNAHTLLAGVVRAIPGTFFTPYNRAPIASTVCLALIIRPGVVRAILGTFLTPYNRAPIASTVLNAHIIRPGVVRASLGTFLTPFGLALIAPTVLNAQILRARSIFCRVGTLVHDAARTSSVFYTPMLFAGISRRFLTTAHGL